MAISAYAIDNAEYTFCDDIQVVRGIDGGAVQMRTELPWAFVRFADGSEPNRYVMPINGTSFVFNGSLVVRYSLTEVMPYQAWPLETSRPARTSNASPDNAGGPVAVHFYGWI
jgi:hypothetical protein